MKIEPNKVVKAEYELYVKGEENELELVEKTTPEMPLDFIFGMGFMLPKFEEKLEGLSTGDSFEFELSENEAYGEYVDEKVIDLERSVFEINGKIDEKVIYEGNIVPLMDSEGNKLNAEIVSINDTHVKIDINHPLAGETLIFKGKVLEVRDVTDEDLMALHGGGGCGCGGCGCGDEMNSGCGCGDEGDEMLGSDCCGGGCSC